MEEKKSLSYKFYRRKTIEKTQKNLNYLGYKHQEDAVSYLDNQVFITILIGILLFCFLPSKYNIFSVIIAFLYYLYFKEILLQNKIKKRQIKLENDAIFFFEVLVLALESGKNLTESLKLTTMSVNSELSKEFQCALDEMQYGKTVKEALEDLKARIPSTMIRNIILNIEQANTYENSLTTTLQNQVEYLKNSKVMRIKEYMNQLPIKISVISVLVFIPLVLMLLLSPAIIEYLGL